MSIHRGICRGVFVLIKEKRTHPEPHTLHTSQACDVAKDLLLKIRDVGSNEEGLWLIEEALGHLGCPWGDGRWFLFQGKYHETEKIVEIEHAEGLGDEEAVQGRGTESSDDKQGAEEIPCDGSERGLGCDCGDGSRHKIESGEFLPSREDQEDPFDDPYDRED